MRCDGEPVRLGMRTTRRMSRASQPDKQNGTLSVHTIKASGHVHRSNRPNTRLHPTHHARPSNPSLQCGSHPHRIFGLPRGSRAIRWAMAFPVCRVAPFRGSSMSSKWDVRAIWLGRHVLPHEAALRVWLSRRRVPGLEVDDVIQETYSRLLTAASVEHVRNPKAYAFQTAGSVLIDHFRRLKVISITAVSNFEQLQVGSDEPSPERQTIDRDELYRLAEAITALPESVREVLRLRRIEGLSQREVSERLGIPENTLEKRMARAHILLLRSFQEGGTAVPEASISRFSSETSERDGKKNHPGN
jgi:RNA polymerase sigma factor (sigma-70 family)